MINCLTSLGDQQFYQQLVSIFYYFLQFIFWNFSALFMSEIIVHHAFSPTEFVISIYAYMIRDL